MSLKRRVTKLERASTDAPGFWPDWNVLYRMQAGGPVTAEERAFWSQFYRRVERPDPVEEAIQAPLRRPPPPAPVTTDAKPTPPALKGRPPPADRR